jgi:hypothetical protein
MQGKVKNAFAAVAAGHHATPTVDGVQHLQQCGHRARYAQKSMGAARLDCGLGLPPWNGTQDILRRRFGFLLQHSPLRSLSRTGSAQETGAGKGAGKTLNVPLPPGASDAQIVEAFKTSSFPRREIKPDLILISAGLTGCATTCSASSTLPRRVSGHHAHRGWLAKELCQGRLVSCARGRLPSRWPC